MSLDNLNTKDFVQDGKALLIDKLRKKQEILDFLEIQLKTVQDLSESVLVYINAMKSLDSMTGFMLDMAGSWIGCNRGGLQDDPYREAIKLQIAINTSDGTLPSILSVIKVLTGSSNIIYTPEYPATFSVSVNGDVYPGLGEAINRISAAGVLARIVAVPEEGLVMGLADYGVLRSDTFGTLYDKGMVAAGEEHLAGVMGDSVS